MCESPSYMHKLLHGNKCAHFAVSCVRIETQRRMSSAPVTFHIDASAADQVLSKPTALVVSPASATPKNTASLSTPTPAPQAEIEELIAKARVAGTDAESEDPGTGCVFSGLRQDPRVVFKLTAAMLFIAGVSTL